MGEDQIPDTANPAPAAPVPTNHPTAIWYFFWGEFAERSSYYGMRVVLFMYLTKGLGFADTEATKVSSRFKMACYFLPLVGGYIADRWLGRYWTIVGFSVPYVLGHFILGIPNETALIIALALLAGGSGVIKPNISTMLGQTYDKFRPGQERLRSSAFMWFYASINYGALISMIAMPFLREWFGYAVAFQFPAWLMVIALTVFAAGKRFYALDRPARQEMTTEERRLQWKTLARLFGVFGLIVFFWVAYEQNDNLWIAFTRDYVNPKLPVLGWHVSPDHFQFLNALFVIILVPVFTWFFKKYDPKLCVFTPMRKILVGFLMTAAAAGSMALAGYLTETHVEHVMAAPSQAGIIGGAIVTGKVWVCTSKVSLLWIVVTFFILTIGEVLLYGTALELAYTAAPKSMKGMVTACFLLTNTLGNFINSYWTPMYGGSLTDPVDKRGPLPPSELFGYTALMVVVVAVAFYFVGKWFERGQASDAAAAGHG